MTRSFPILTVALLAFGLPAAPLLAQALNGSNLTLSGVITQNGSGSNFFDANINTFSGRACIGNSCDGTEPFEQGPLRLKWSEPDILFEDSSTTSGISSNDWRLVINESTVTKFAVQDIDGGTFPFTIEGAVPTNSLVLDSTGRIGMGTAIPQASLDIVSANPAIRMQQSGSPNIWTMTAETLFTLNDNTASSTPVIFEPGAPSDSLRLAANGNIGLGINAPEQKLHIRSNATDTDAFALFDANGPGSDAAFLLRQNGTIPTTWEFRNQEGSGRLNVGLAGGNTPFKIDNLANNNLVRLGLNGQPDAVVVTGRLLVNTTQLNVPDYVFGDDYALRPLSEVRSFIDANGHLPEVPSAAQIATTGVDMTQMQMTLLKKVEELTLYTLALEDSVTALRAELALLRTPE